MGTLENEYFQLNALAYIQTIANGGYGLIFLVYSIYMVLKKMPEENYIEAEIQCLTAIDNPRIVKLYQYYITNVILVC